MQTFLPYPDIVKSVEILDSTRLWKQVLECWQICHGHWKTHPASIMWIGYDPALRYYGYEAAKAAVRRGIKVEEKYFEYFTYEMDQDMPWWFGHPRFHKSHLDNLIWKWKPVGVQPPYVWPVHKYEWEHIPFGVQINRRKKPIYGIKTELVPGRTTTNKPCFFLLQGFNHG